MGWAAPIVSGIGQYQAAQGEKAQYNFNAKSEMIGADQSDAQRRSDLLDTLSLTNAIRSSRGLELGSPTGLAISQGMTKQAEAGISTARLNYLSRAQSDLYGAWGAEQKGTYALYGGFLQGIDQLENPPGAGQAAAMAGG
jgi:hypothetical protein